MHAPACLPACLVTLQDGKLSGGRRMAAGFMAGITEALIIVTPFEVRWASQDGHTMPHRLGVA